MNAILSKILPNYAPDGPLGTEKKGLLSPIGDAVGQILQYGLSPLGYVLGHVANPPGEALLAAEEHVKEQVGYEKEEHKPDSEWPGGERVGGNPQNGQNPLGL